MRRARIALLVPALALASLGARHLRDGPFARTVAVGQYPTSIAVDERAGHAFVVNGADSTVSMLDAVSGDLLRTIPVGLGPVSVAADAATHRAFVLDSGGNAVSVLDTVSGAPVATIPTGGSPELAGIDEGTGHVFVSLKNPPALWMLDGRSGAVLHIAPLPDGATALRADPRAGRLVVATPSTLTFWDTRSGALLHAVSDDAYPLALAVDTARGHVFVLDGGDGGVTMRDSRTGAPLAHASAAASAIVIAAAASTGRVFVAEEGDSASGSDQGRVALLDAASDRQIASVPIAGSPIALAVDERDRRVFVDTGNDVDVLDARTGRLLRVIADSGARITSEAIAVDGRTGRAFVLDTYDPSAETINPLVRFLRRWLPRLAPAPPQSHGSVHIVDAAQ